MEGYSRVDEVEVVAVVDPVANAREEYQREFGIANAYETIEEMLAQWWRWRRPHVLAYQRLSRWFTPVFQGDNRIWGWLRDLLLPLACRTPVVKQRGLAMMTGVQCGWLGTLDPLTLRRRNAGIGRMKSL